MQFLTEFFYDVPSTWRWALLYGVVRVRLLQLAVQPFLSSRPIDFGGIGYLLDRYLVTSTPYSSRWVSTFILCHVFDVEVSQVQNCREVDLVNVLQL